MLVSSCATLGPTIAPVNGSAPADRRSANDGRTVADAPTANPKLSSRTVSLKTDRFVLAETYPVLSPDAPAASAINARIASAIGEAERNFLDEAEKAAELELHAPWEFAVAWTLSEYSGDRFSALLEIYAYTGGAHGSTTLVPVNFDAGAGTEILLADLWKASSKGGTATENGWTDWLDWLEALSAAARPLLAAELERTAQAAPDAAWLEAGTAPEEANFRIFTLKKDAVVFRFAQYQVAPYSSGMPEITILLDSLAGK